MNEARDRGDPRYAGYALAALAPWRDAVDHDRAPDDVAVLQATLAQYQHDFDGARRMLERVLARRPDHAQARLTLATIARVQGRYADSDAACRLVAVPLYASACLAENLALRGRFDEARHALTALIASLPSRDAGTANVRRWLLTTRAELEQRAARGDAARIDFEAAMQLGRDSYLVLDEADFLLEQGKAAEAERLLAKEPEPYGDGVLLRLAIAAARLGRGDAKVFADQLAERFAASLERGDAISIHGREYARYLDEVAHQPAKAVAVARDNLRVQKEPADFLAMADAARSAHDESAMREVTDLARSIGLEDRRLQRAAAR